MFFFSVTASFTLLFVGFEIYSPDAEGKLQNNSPKRPTSASRVQNHYYYCYGSGRGKDILKFLVDLKKEMKGELDQLTKTVANFRMGFKEVIQKHEKQLSQVDQRLESFDKQVNSSHAELKLNQDRILHKISGNFVNLKKELLHIKQKCGSCARACSTSLGAAVGGRLPDSSFSASSFYNSGHAGKDGRLNKSPNAWCPKYPTLANNDYLQVDLGAVTTICGVATQGKDTEWTTKYKLKLSTDGKTWTTYKEGGSDKVFKGNSDAHTIVKNVLPAATAARYVRFIPTAKANQKWSCLRVELYSWS